MTSKYGLYFPILFDEDGLLMEPDIVSSVTSSLRHILVWFRGTRYFNVPFGSGVPSFLGLPSTPLNLSLLKTHISLSVLTQEPRIEVKDINLSLNDFGRVSLSISYIIKKLRLQSEFQTEI